MAEKIRGVRVGLNDRPQPDDARLCATILSGDRYHSDRLVRRYVVDARLKPAGRPRNRRKTGRGRGEHAGVPFPCAAGVAVQRRLRAVGERQKINRSRRPGENLSYRSTKYGCFYIRSQHTSPSRQDMNHPRRRFVIQAGVVARVKRGRAGCQPTSGMAER
jgi:hypothetical protein